jgi:starch-binding outer membrane protein, SusD/RagB family
MKNIKIFILALLLSISQGCNNFIDLKPTHTLVKDNAYISIEDYETGLTGVYNGLLFTGYYGRNYLCMPEYMTDNLKRTPELFSGQDDTDNWLFNPLADRIIDAWQSPYVVINRANAIINNVGSVAEKVPGQRNRILGQALVLRAIAHFDLLRFFGQEYDRNSTKLGIPVRTQNELSYPARNTVKEVYDQVFADLDQAFTVLATIDRPINTATNRWFFDRVAARALTARVALYAKDYTLARTAANDVITTAGYSLAPIAQFEQIWRNDAVLGEVIMAINPLPNQIMANDWYSPASNFNTFAPSASLMNLYDQVNDVRFGIYFARRTSPAPLDIVGKYLGRSPLRNGVNDQKILRISEMYLIRAEAAFRGGQEASALADLNALRATRITSYTNQTISGTALLDAILLEKRKELAFEGHRWFELRRNGLAIVRSECAPPCINSTLPANSTKFVLPIPQNEMTANKNMVQNDGY